MLKIFFRNKEIENIKSFSLTVGNIPFSVLYTQKEIKEAIKRENMKPKKPCNTDKINHY